MRTNPHVISLILLGMILMGVVAHCNRSQEAGLKTEQMNMSPIQRSWLEVICSAQGLATLVAGQVAVTSGRHSRMKYRHARHDHGTAIDD